MEYDMKIFLSDVKIIDEMISDQCPLVDDLFEKYDKRYDPDLPASELIIEEKNNVILVHANV